MDKQGSVTLNVHLFHPESMIFVLQWAITHKLNSAPATAETWNFKGRVLRVNAVSSTAIAQDSFFNWLGSFVSWELSENRFIAEDEGAVGLSYVSYVNSE
jgi:hypothetical protein